MDAHHFVHTNMDVQCIQYANHTLHIRTCIHITIHTRTPHHTTCMGTYKMYPMPQPRNLDLTQRSQHCGKRDHHITLHMSMLSTFTPSMGPKLPKPRSCLPCKLHPDHTIGTTEAPTSVITAYFPLIHPHSERAPGTASIKL